MKVLSKYFPTKTENSTARTPAGNPPKDTSFKSNRDSIVSNKSVENKRYLYSKAKEEEAAEEEKILNWLLNCDGDHDDNAKPDAGGESLRNEEVRDNAERANNSRNGDARENHSADNIDDAPNEKQWPTRTIVDKIPSSVDDIVNSSTPDESSIIRRSQDSPKIKSELSLRDTAELNDNESAKITKDCLPESRPLRSPTRRTGQRKISEFFQRTL